MTIEKKRKALSKIDLETVRQQYEEAQHWTRHYEQLIVNANVLMVSASLIFLGFGMSDKVSRAEGAFLLVVPGFMAIAGIAMTLTLFNLYAGSIERMIRLEALLGCNDGERMAEIDGLGPLVAAHLHTVPVAKPTSVRFFIGLHIMLMVSYAVLAIVKYHFAG